MLVVLVSILAFQVLLLALAVNGFKILNRTIRDKQTKNDIRVDVEKPDMPEVRVYNEISTKKIVEALNNINDSLKEAGKDVSHVRSYLKTLRNNRK